MVRKTMYFFFRKTVEYKGESNRQTKGYRV